MLVQIHVTEVFSFLTRFMVAAMCTCFYLFLVDFSALMACSHINAITLHAHGGVFCEMHSFPIPYTL